MSTPQLATSIKIGVPVTFPGEDGWPSITLVADRVIGSGTFGVVYLARIQDEESGKTDEIVAVKKVLQDRRYKNRELSIMKTIKHPNCVGLKGFCLTPGARTHEIYLNLVMDYYPETVFSVVKEYARMRQSMPMIHARLFSYQMVRSLLYLHSHGIAHRDIKPQNLLVDPKSGKLALCDMGSAKVLVPGQPNVAYICSRYYRAPELIFGATDYTPAIDLWSLGCVVSELLLSRPLFPGDTGVDQLVEIIKVLGTPTRDQILTMNKHYTDYRFPSVRPHPWTRVFRSRTPPDAVDFVQSILVYDPAARPSPAALLSHPFLNRLREQATTLPDGGPLPRLFNFTAEEYGLMTAAEMQAIVPEWARDHTWAASMASKGK